MGIAHITLFLLALLLTTWGTSLVLRALATKLASLRRTPPLSWMFRGNSIWDPKPESIGTPRASLTTLLGIAAALIGVACFTFRNKLDVERETTQGDMLTSGLAGLLLSAALAALLTGLFADRSAGRKRCPKCWYDMQGHLTHQCPECGHTTKHEKHFFRTRRSQGMLALACLLILLAALPRAIMGYRANGWMGATPTWAMILFVDYLPTSWAQPAVGSERFGTLIERWKRLEPFEKPMLLYQMNRYLAKDYGVLFSRYAVPQASNLDALRIGKPEIAHFALATDAGIRDVSSRFHFLMSKSPNEVTDIEISEIGFLTAQLLSYAPDLVKGDQAPRLHNSVVERLVKFDFSRNGTASWSAVGAMSSRLQDPRHACEVLLQQFDQQITLKAKDTRSLLYMLNKLIESEPSEFETVERYLLNADAPQQFVLLDYASFKPFSSHVILSLRNSTDERVRLAAELQQVPDDLPPDSKCEYIVAAYNNATSDPDYFFSVLRDNRCPVLQAMPGILRDLQADNRDLVYEIVRVLREQQVCDERLAQPLIQLLRNSMLYDPDRAYELLLRANPTFDPATFSQAPNP